MDTAPGTGNTQLERQQMTIRAISYGGGVQSTAMVVLAAQKIIDYPIALFSNVGDDSEHPATLEYVRNIAIPWAAEHGVEIHELQRTKKDGTVETLMGRITREGSKSIAIPVRLTNGMPASRSCTADFKIAVVGKWLKAHGANADDKATVAIGISTDEIQRINNKKPEKYQTVEYPLIDLRLSRSDCKQIIKKAGLPVPPKSSCFFCPFHRPLVWSEMRRDEPELFEKAADLEMHMIERQINLGREPVYFTDRKKPLRQAINTAQTPLFIDDDGPEQCDSGYCFT